jgi:phosphatidylserine/phosphatidylglycerophosphate/cardiolipin synthase-like enzyme
MKKWLLVIFITLASPLAIASSPSASEIEVTFSPNGGATEAIVSLIGEAKKSIRVAACIFTSKEIAQALLDAHKRGVDVQVVLDKLNNSMKYSSAPFLLNGGVLTRINYKYAIMYNKFMVIDDVTVQTGSFSYTYNAEHKNAENVIILRNNPDVAARYLQEWQILWDESEEQTLWSSFGYRHHS